MATLPAKRLLPFTPSVVGLRAYLTGLLPVTRKMIFLYRNEYETALESLSRLPPESMYWVVPIPPIFNPLGAGPLPNRDIPNREIRFQRDGKGEWQCIDEIVYLD